jgi:hypothetical protein
MQAWYVLGICLIRKLFIGTMGDGAKAIVLLHENTLAVAGV